MSSKTSATGADTQDILEWAKQDKREMLHAVYRVGDLQRSIEFYTNNFGAKLLRYRDNKDEKYTNAFLGFGPEDKDFFSLELTYNYGQETYDLGEGFGHFGLAVPDVYEAVKKVKENGGKVTRDAGPVKGGKTVIAFVEDPTGYKWELIQRPSESIRDPICQVMLRVMDLKKSIKFYTEALGCKLLRTRENEEGRYTLAFLGYGEETDAPVFELTYNWDRKEPYSKGDNPGYAQVAISTQDVYKAAEAIRAAGFQVSKEPGPLPGLGTHITAALDPDGYKVVLVDRKDLEKELSDYEAEQK